MSHLETIQSLCVKYANSKGVSFTYKNKSLSHDEVFAVFGILPGIIKRASKISSVSSATSFSATYPKKDRSYLGYEVSLGDDISVPILMIFILDVLELVIGGATEGSTVGLDEFAYE